MSVPRFRRAPGRALVPLDHRHCKPVFDDRQERPVRHTQWNRIEHRLFADISQNWRGKPLVSHQVIIQLISATTTNTALTVTCDIDRNAYPKGVQVTNAEMAELNIERDAFHGDWNYTIAPRQQALP